MNKEETKKYKREYYLRNKEEILKRGKEYYIMNKRKVLDINKDWSDRNKERHQLIKDKWAILNRDKKRKSANLYAKKNIEKLRRNRKNYRTNNKKIVNAQNKASKIPMEIQCAICKSKNNLERHHWDYNKPILFSTLCRECHNIQHHPQMIIERGKKIKYGS